MEKICFVAYHNYDVVLYDSFEEAKEGYLEYSDDQPLDVDGSERIVVADAMEIDFLAEECKTDTALFIDEDTDWVVYLEKEVNEEIAELRKYKDYPNARLFELRNVKKFKPKTVFVLDEE
jgi:hypothetical protein